MRDEDKRKKKGLGLGSGEGGGGEEEKGEAINVKRNEKGKREGREGIKEKMQLFESQLMVLGGVNKP